MATQLASTYADLSLFIGGEWLTGDGRKTSPVINPAGNVVQVVAVVWDATGTRRLQQKIDAIDKAAHVLAGIVVKHG